MLLEKLHLMVQNFIKGISNRGAVINWSVASAAAKSFTKKYPGVIGGIDVDSSSWAQSLFHRMGFSRAGKSPQRLTYQQLYEIVLREEQYAIPDSLIINFDQTPLKLVECGNNTHAKK